MSQEFCPCCHGSGEEPSVLTLGPAPCCRVCRGSGLVWCWPVVEEVRFAARPARGEEEEA